MNASSNQDKKIRVRKRNGRLESLDVSKINASVVRACEDLDDVSASEIVLDATIQLYDKVTTSEIDDSLIMCTRNKIEKDPNYSYVAARLLLNKVYKEVFKEGVDVETFELLYKKSFISHVKKLTKKGILNKEILSIYDLKDLGDYLKIERDQKFKYFGLKTLSDRYFIRLDKKIMEAPQSFFMRVAMGLAMNENNPQEMCKQFYDMISDFRFMPSSPTLFNSATNRAQLSSCYLNIWEDSIDGIFHGYWQEARKSKFAGGLGVSVSNIRATGSYIAGTNGISTGLIPWLKILNDLCIAVNQSGKRPGACCVYLEPWHLDVEEYLDLRKNTGDDRRRTHDLHTALWISDLFMRLKEDPEADWYLFSPEEVPQLHESYGQDFETKYYECCKAADEGDIKVFKKVKARDLWRKCLTALFSTGHPWITFKDPCNLRYSNSHQGVVHSSNLCTEITLHTKHSQYDKGTVKETGETAVCNLASLNLREHLVESKGSLVLDGEKLAKSIFVAVRALDNVIDLNYYPTDESQNSNLRNRPVGLGVMGWQDLFHAYKIPYDSPEAIQLSSQIQEFISYRTIEASSSLSQERGSYENFEGSFWSKGILPSDTFSPVEIEIHNQIKNSEDLDWEDLRERVKNGMRNGLTQAIAPNATIGLIVGCEASIEPDYKILYIKETKSGSAIYLNEWFVRDLKKLDLWTPEILQQLKMNDGSVQNLNLPDHIKNQYKTAFEYDQKMLMYCTAARQKWLDQAISHNVYCANASGKFLDELYTHAWKIGMKTTYYLRTLGATRIEKTTVEEKPQVISGPVCNMDEDCESCQ